MHRGDVVASFRLDHGDDPVGGLLVRGWEGSVVAAQGALGDLTLLYAVDPAPGPAPATSVVSGVPTAPIEAPVPHRQHRQHRPHGPGLTGEERQVVVPRQRVAAYAVVVSDERLLLTRLAAGTGADGRWNLPGGGLDPGETPTEGVVREVLEETGQEVDEVRLVDVMTHHWVGRSSRGIEDYHAVRLIHVARCERPTRPVVHDVGGSTSEARWVPLAELSSVAVVASVPVALRAVGLAGDDHA